MGPRPDKIFCDLKVGSHFSFRGYKDESYVKKDDHSAIRTRHWSHEAGSIFRLDSYARSYPVEEIPSYNVSLDKICNYIRNQ